MNFELEIVNKLKDEEATLRKLKNSKLNAKRISEEKDFLMQCVEKEYYIKGMRDALMIMQKKRD